MIRHYQRAVKKAARRQRAKDGEIASLATEALTAMPVVKAFGTEQFEHDRVERSSEERLEVGVEAVRLEARFGGLVDMIGAVSTAIILTLGVVSVAEGRITPGTLVVFVAYSGKLYKPLRDIARQTTRWARTMARLERIGEILHCDEVLGEGSGQAAPRRPPAEGDLRLEDVSFRYRPERWAVRRSTCTSPPASGSRSSVPPAPEVDDRCAGRPVLRPDVRPRLLRRPGRPGVLAGVAARAGRRPAAGHDPVQRHHPREHRLRP